MIDDTTTTVRIPHRKLRDRRGRLHADVNDDERISVEIHDAQYLWPLRLFFESLAPDAPLVGVEFGSEAEPHSELDLAEVARVAGNLSLYEQYARATMIWGEGRGDAAQALKMLSNVGTTRRGLPAGFYRIIADEYRTRVEAGESAPVTAIAQAHGVYKSTASRWLKEARRRRYIDDRKEKS